MPGFRWWLPRAYGRLWQRLTVMLHHAAELAERRPLPFLGLAIVRVAAILPVLSVFLRPLVPVCATVIACSDL